LIDYRAVNEEGRHRHVSRFTVVFGHAQEAVGKLYGPGDVISRFDIEPHRYQTLQAACEAAF
jgi:hypothetical protein